MTKKKQRKKKNKDEAYSFIFWSNVLMFQMARFNSDVHIWILQSSNTLVIYYTSIVNRNTIVIKGEKEKQLIFFPNPKYQLDDNIYKSINNKNKRQKKNNSLL